MNFSVFARLLMYCTTIRMETSNISTSACQQYISHQDIAPALARLGQKRENERERSRCGLHRGTPRLYMSDWTGYIGRLGPDHGSNLDEGNAPNGKVETPMALLPLTKGQQLHG